MGENEAAFVTLHKNPNGFFGILHDDMQGQSLYNLTTIKP